MCASAAVGANTLSGIEACAFDAYGTLFDVYSAVACQRERLGQQADSVLALWRAKQLEYTWLRSLMGRHADFAQVTAEALDYSLHAHGLRDGLHADLLDAFRCLDIFPDVRSTLDAIRKAGVTTAILSNGTPAMIKELVAHAGLGKHFDVLISVEEAGVYKPAPRIYALAETHLRVPLGRIAFVSANGWDAAGAAAAGMQSVWINRRGAVPERLPHRPAAEIQSLTELPALIGIESISARISHQGGSGRNSKH